MSQPLIVSGTRRVVLGSLINHAHNFFDLIVYSGELYRKILKIFAAKLRHDSKFNIVANEPYNI